MSGQLFILLLLIDKELATARFVRKQDPYIKAWDKLLFEVQDWDADIVFLSVGIQTTFYNRYCESINFKSQAISHLKRITEDWEKDRKTLDKISNRYANIRQLMANLENIGWNGKSNLQSVYEQIKEQMRWISDTLKFIQGDLQSAQRIGSQAEAAEIQRYIQELTPQIMTIYGFYQRSLQNIEDMDRRLRQ